MFSTALKKKLLSYFKGESKYVCNDALKKIIAKAANSGKKL
jgi:hypothetical protein